MFDAFLRCPLQSSYSHTFWKQIFQLQTCWKHITNKNQ